MLEQSESLSPAKSECKAETHARDTWRRARQWNYLQNGQIVAGRREWQAPILLAQITANKGAWNAAVSHVTQREEGNCHALPGIKCHVFMYNKNGEACANEGKHLLEALLSKVV